MPYVDEDGILVYKTPTNWSEITTDYKGNGDCADWVEAIRAALIERFNILINGERSVSNVGNYMYDLQKGFHCNCEIYSFAKAVERALDFMLTPYREWGTIYNTDGPGYEDGYWINPGNFMKKIVYDEPATATERTETVPNFLKIQDVISSDHRDYKSAINLVRRGDTPDKFVPFFNKVMNAINYLHVVPCSVWARHVSGGIVQTERYETVSGVHDEIASNWESTTSGEPALKNIEKSSGFWLRNLIRYYYGGVYYTGHYYWDNIWVKGVANKWPAITMKVYYGLYAHKVLTAAATNNEYSWGASEYTPEIGSFGNASGITHDLAGSMSSHRIPPIGGLTYPLAPSEGESNMRGYEMDVMFFADFAVNGGFNFKTVE